MNITIPDELRVKLRKEPNQSGLIAELLFKYYDKGEDVEMLKIQRDKLVNTYNDDLKEIDYQIELIEKEKETIEEAEANKEAQREAKIYNVKDTANKLFNVTMDDASAIEYLDGKYDTLSEYLDSKKEDGKT